MATFTTVNVINTDNNPVITNDTIRNSINDNAAVWKMEPKSKYTTYIVEPFEESDKPEYLNESILLIDLFEKYKKLEKKYDDLVKKFEELDLHIKYAPDGEGAGEAKKHFEELSEEQKK